MARIYFDSNVFSNLRNGSQEKYIALRKKIEEYKGNLGFLFSHAHIRDKIKDTSDFKFEDFEYMETLVGNNYLSYHALEKNTNFYLATPSEVFEDNDSLDDVGFVMNMIGRSYKEVRDIIEKTGNVPYRIGNEVFVLSEVFSDGRIQKRFVDFVKASLYHEDKNNIPYYDFYLHAYSILDSFGFSKDKLGKKNSYNNVFNDSLHSYYARYCDYFVTEDDGLIKKSSLLYNEYKVATKILSVDEFLMKVDEIGQSTETTVPNFFNKLSMDLSSGDIVSKSSEGKVNTYIIKTKERYFNFFDLLMVLRSEDAVHVFITKEELHYLSEPNYKEKEMITNRVVEVFDEDLGGKVMFNWELEKEEIEKRKWVGRYWELGDTHIHLQINEGSKDFCIQIGPLNRWHFISHFK